MPEIITKHVEKDAIIELINFDEETSWIRWFLPDWSNNGNIDLPKGNYKVISRNGVEIKLQKI
jgi:hypothetical protein